MPESDKLSPQQVDAIAFIEQVWYETKSLPTNERIADVCGYALSTVTSWWKKQVFRDALMARGVSLRDTEEGDIRLTYQQMDVVNRLLNTLDKSSNREKLEECGASTHQLNSWMRDPVFRAFYEKRVKEKFSDADSTAYMSIVRGMESGDLRATQLYLEMRGIYNPKVSIEVNVDQVLVRLVEIVSRHVKDPDILQAIARDIDSIPGVGVTNVLETPAPIDVSSSPTPLGMSI